MKNKKIFLILFFLFIIIIIFTAEKPNKEIYNIKYSGGKNIYYLPGIKIICSYDSNINIKNNIIKSAKGRIWITATKRSLLKIILDKKNIEINGATVDINTTNNYLTVFNGTIYISGQRVNKGQTINLTNMITSVIKDMDEWQAENIKSETTFISVEIQGGKEKKEIFNKKLKEILKNNYWTSKESEPEFLLKINISEPDGGIKGTITHILSNKIIVVIDEKIAENYDNDIPLEISAINIANKIISLINSFIEDELYSGRVIIIETSDFKDDDLKEFRKILSIIPEIKILEENNYYDIKNVFKVNYIGTGYDIIEFIKNSNINDKKLNIWYISKNNLKIKI